MERQDSTKTEAIIDPKQWPSSVKKRAILCVGLFAFLQPFASSMIAPCLQLIANEFHVQSSIIRNLYLSAFVLPFAFGTLLMAPLSEWAGRKPVLLFSASIFMTFTIACGFAQSSAQLIIFRVLAGSGACAPLATGAAIMGDLYEPRKRGSAMASYWTLQMAGPVIGPIVGGWVAQRAETWRWLFYGCSIATALAILIGAVFLPETYAPKLNRLEKVPLSVCFQSLARPFIFLKSEPIIQVLGAYAAIIFGIFYLFITTVATVFHDSYSQSIGISSLHYLAMLLGFLVSLLASGKAMDMLYSRLTIGGEFPEARIPYLAASATFLPAGLLVYGWTAQYGKFWLAPDVGLFLVALGLVSPLAAIQHYIIDSYSKQGFAASALAAMNLARFLAGFGFPLFADEMFDSLGLGWGNSLLALVAVVTGSLSVSLWKFGPKLRARSSFAL
ncbi:major facilitator superfamily domain-containing protein [Xylariales sp. PMI_506]|nr:major facilitator superfamily domain-containing protein [Xylariales sp. PMI_506]